MGTQNGHIAPSFKSVSLKKSKFCGDQIGRESLAVFIVLITFTNFLLLFLFTIFYLSKNAYMWPDSCPGAHLLFWPKNAYMWPDSCLLAHISFGQKCLHATRLLPVSTHTRYFAKIGYIWPDSCPGAHLRYLAKMPTCGLILAQEHTYIIWPKMPECGYIFALEHMLYLAKNVYMWSDSCS